MSETVRTTCPYCGVGCGVLVKVDYTGQVTVRGDPDHPANYGRLCSKGAALAETLDHDGRLLYPEINGMRSDWDTALDNVADGFSRVIQQHGPDAVAFYVSGQLLTEDYYVANKLMKGFIGSANIDTNSRLCMSSAVAGYKRAFGSDTVPCSYSDLERAKLIVLVGSNTAWCHPVVYQRIATARKNNPDLMIVVIDPRHTATCEIADMHLALLPGSDVLLFNGLLAYIGAEGEINEAFVEANTEGIDAALQAARDEAGTLEQVAAGTGLDTEQISRFYRLFARTERVVSVFSQGVNQSSHGTDKVNSIINCHLVTGRIGRPGMGPFSITGQPNAMGGREVGGLANQLAAHMDITVPADRDRVQRFWHSPVIAGTEGLKAVDLFAAVESGRIKAVWIMATNPAVSLPDADRVRAALKACDLVVVSDVVRHTDTTDCADILLPASAWGEKDGMVTNSERCLSRQRVFLDQPGEARPDWWIITQVARRMGYNEAFPYEDALSIFREHAALSAFENEGSRDFDIGGLSKLSAAEYAAMQPCQWPLPEKRQAAASHRLFSDGRFYTSSGKACIVSVRCEVPGNAIDDEYPLVLNTGRVRDQWHTMTRTAKSPRLCRHTPIPCAEVHPMDAASRNIKDGDLVEIRSQWGRVQLRAAITENQQPGSVFAPIHWSDQFTSGGRVGDVVNPVTDSVSGQPESKHTPVSLNVVQHAWRGFAISRSLLDTKDFSYWTRITARQCWRYEFSCSQAPASWPDFIKSLMAVDMSHLNWIEYSDSQRGTYRAGCFDGDRLEACVFVSATGELPDTSWLQDLMAADTINDRERMMLLSGGPGDNYVDKGRIVCSCHGIGEKQLIEAIRNRQLYTVEAVGNFLKAGTECGSCRPELEALIEGVLSSEHN